MTVYRQSNCDYRNIIAVPRYGLTVGKNNASANIKVYNGNIYGIGFFFCLHNKWLILCFQRDMEIFINTDMKKNIVIVN